MFGLRLTEGGFASADPTGCVAYITGGASGIGLAVAGLLQHRGMKLALMDLTEPTLQAAEAMCDSWRIELAHHGVDVTCLHPLWVTTPMVERGRESLAFARLRKAMAEPLEREQLAAAQALEARYLDDLKRGLNPGGMPSAPRSP